MPGKHQGDRQAERVTGERPGGTKEADRQRYRQVRRQLQAPGTFPKRGGKDPARTIMEDQGRRAHPLKK